MSVLLLQKPRRSNSSLLSPDVSKWRRRPLVRYELNPADDAVSLLSSLILDQPESLFSLIFSKETTHGFDLKE
jgi:hypothetical protein